jgi:hypothetical protein
MPCLRRVRLREVLVGRRGRLPRLWAAGAGALDHVVQTSGQVHESGRDESGCDSAGPTGTGRPPHIDLCARVGRPRLDVAGGGRRGHAGHAGPRPGRPDRPRRNDRVESECAAGHQGTFDRHSGRTCPVERSSSAIRNDQHHQRSWSDRIRPDRAANGRPDRPDAAAHGPADRATADAGTNDAAANECTLADRHPQPDSGSATHA